MDDYDITIIVVMVILSCFGILLITGVYVGSQPSGETLTGIVNNVIVDIERSSVASTLYLDDGQVITVYTNYQVPTFIIGGNYTFFYNNVHEISYWELNS